MMDSTGQRQYIGIDIGDGETAVAALWEGSVIEPVMQSLGQKKSILSVVGNVGPDLRIGDAALLSPNIANLRARFKSRFLKDPAAASDIRRFAQGLMEALTQHATAFSQGGFRIALGCPAGWTAEDRARYADILRSVGFENLYTVSESRAAFMYAKHAHNILVDASLLSKNTLVIDIGSSTTDFAYIVDGHESSVGTFGHVNLGGGLIEAYMLEGAVARSPQEGEIRRIFAEEPTWRHYCEIAARKLKEQYFLDENAWTGKDCAASATVYYDEPVTLHFSLSAGEVERLLRLPMAELSGQSFLEALDASLRHAAETTRAAPPDLLILTGGAARMAFFRAACVAAFPGAVIALCPEPEYSIAKGLAYAARVDARLSAFHADMDAYFESGRIREHVLLSLPQLAEALAPALSDLIVEEAAIPAIRQWREGSTGTLAELERALAAKAEALLQRPETTEGLAPFIAEWSRALLSLIQADLYEITARHHLDRTAMSLSGVKATAQVEAISIALPGDSLSVLLYAITGLVVASLAGGGQVALIAAGPLGLLAGAVIGVVVGMLGVKAGREAFRTLNVPSFLRKALPMFAYTRSLRGEKQRKKIQTALYKSLSDREGVFARQLVADIGRDIQAQIHAMAQAVEMPVY